MRSRVGLALLVILSSSSGCSYDWNRFEADAGAEDTSTPPDTGEPTDTGSPTDTGVPTDSGPTDTGTPDTGVVSGLVLHLPLDEGSGTSTTERVSGRIGEVRGAEFITGVDGTGLRFVPDDDVLVTLPAPMNVQPRFTIAAWARMADRATGTIIACHGNPHFSFRYSSNDDGQLEGISGRINHMSWPSFRLLAPRAALVPDTWQHVAFSVDGTSLAIYVDGAEVDTRTIDAVPADEGSPSAECYIGQSGFSFGERLTGDLDDVRIYDRPLSLAEIRVLARL